MSSFPNLERPQQEATDGAAHRRQQGPRGRRQDAARPPVPPLTSGEFLTCGRSSVTKGSSSSESRRESSLDPTRLLQRLVMIFVSPITERNGSDFKPGWLDTPLSFLSFPTQTA